MSNSTPNQVNGIPVTAENGIDVKAALAAKPFTDWLASVDTTRFTVNSIHFQSVDMFGPRVGFVKFKCAVTDSQGNFIPGIIFARGGAVAVLAILECEGEHHVVVTVQPRLATGSFEFVEICAGMLDGSGNFAGVAAKELDEELGIVFIPTGTPRYDFYGGNREGDNLFGNSLIALDAETGERIWHFQTVHHDLWDFDLPVAPKLMTITRDGEQIPVVIQVTKWGTIFTFDRRDGTPIWPIEERPVPESDVPGEHASPTQPFPTWPEPYMRMEFTVDDINPYLPEADQEALRERFATWRHGGPFMPPSLQGTIAFPGHNGGANWGNVAVDPQRQRLYIVSRELPLGLKIMPDRRPEALEAMPNADEEDLPYRWPVDFMLQSNGMGAMKPPFSNLTAYDMNTGEKLYSIPNGEILTLEEQGITGVGAQTPRSGPVATAGGLLFVNTASDRAFRARDADTGRVLWEHRFDAGTEGVPAIYEVDGRQMITVPVGGMGHFLGGLGLPDPGPSRYVTFALPEGAE